MIVEAHRGNYDGEYGHEQQVLDVDRGTKDRQVAVRERQAVGRGGDETIISSPPL